MIRSTDEFREIFKATRRAGTPLLLVRTADPASATAHLSAVVNPQGSKKAAIALVSWDIMSGVAGLNEAGLEAVGKAFGERAGAIGPADALAAGPKLPTDAVLCVHNAQRFWESPDVLQAIWNLRDVFKSKGQMLVLLATPGATLPVELQPHVVVLDEPLPSAADLSKLARETFDAAGVKRPDEDLIGKAVDALIGLAAFPAEQALSMSLSKAGVDLQRLWERKRQAVEQTPGLSIWQGGEAFDEIGGCGQIKAFLSAVLKGREAPRVVVFIDEIEKAFAGAGTDTSGVKTEMTGTILSWMQDRGADGSLFLGPPGAAKSACAKAAGATAGIPTIAFDLAAMQNSLVGASGERLRAALQVVDAIAEGRSLWIATCNSVTSLPPELRRRFTLGTFFFDLPSAEERRAIWRIYRDRWNVAGDEPDDEGWTGAEIRECCRKAWRLNLTLEESARYIVPVSRSAADQIEALRRQASGRYLSASYPGVYTAAGRTDARPGRVFREDREG